MVKKIISFGCSHTYGHGLSDCFVAPNFPGNKPSNTAWPALVANMLNLPIENLSQPGSSAKQIAHRILNTPITATDIVLVMWPHYNRTCVFKDSNTFTKVGLWMENAEDYFGKFYTDYDAYFEYFAYINFIDLYIKQYTSNTINFLYEQMDMFGFNWNTVSITPIYFNDIKKKHPLSLDNAHPGQLAHDDFALQIYPIVKKYFE